MARYFLHLRDGTDELLDPDGLELPDVDAARKAAMACARDTLSQDMKDGVIDLRYRIDVEDDAKEIVYSLPLKEAFSIIGAD